MTTDNSALKYLDGLAARIKDAPGCEALTDAAREAMESIEQAILDAQGAAEDLLVLVTPPTDLPGVIEWIKAVSKQYAGPYQTYLAQIAIYTAKLTEIQVLLAEKARELACSGLSE